jgi:hypothetical protein
VHLFDARVFDASGAPVDEIACGATIEPGRTTEALCQP